MATSYELKIASGKSVNLPDAITPGKIYITEEHGEVYIDTIKGDRIQTSAGSLSKNINGENLSIEAENVVTVSNIDEEPYDNTIPLDADTLQGKSYDDIVELIKSSGTGDMITNIYDPQKKMQDIFKYADNVLANEKGQINGIATLDESGKVSSEQLPLMNYILNDEKGVANGVAPLNEDGVLDIEYGGTGAKTVQEAIYNLGCMPRENLLPNWKFKINQRGKKQYTDYAYSIDGAFFNGNGTIDVHDDYVDITATSDIAILEFKLENPNQYKGEKLTFALLAQRIAGTGLCYITSIANEYSGEAYANDDLDIISFTKTKAEDIINLTYTIVVAQGNTLRIHAGKFEVGDCQTLGFKDNNGNIHMFEEFDYAKELAKCGRYLLDITPNIKFNASYTAVCTEAGVLYTTIPLPVPMRIVPTLLAETGSFQIALSDGSFPVPESVSIVTMGGNYIALRFMVSSAQIGQVADIRLIDETKKWLLSAEL